jgi:hypothetical protein
MKKYRLYTQSTAYADKHLTGLTTIVYEKFLSPARENADAIVNDMV